jgi:hypothetical protein
MGCILLGGRAAIGYDQGYGGEVVYLVLAVDEKYVGGFVEGGSARMIRMRNSSSGTSGMTRSSGRW